MVHKILNERDADKQVIKSLLRTIARMKGNIMEQPQVKEITLFTGKDGRIKVAQSFADVTRDEIIAEIDIHQTEINRLNVALTEFDAIAATLTPVATIIEAEVVAPNVEQPVPVEAPVEQPAAIETPVAQPEMALTDTTVVEAQPQPTEPTPIEITIQ